LAHSTELAILVVVTFGIAWTKLDRIWKHAGGRAFASVIVSIVFIFKLCVWNRSGEPLPHFASSLAESIENSVGTPLSLARNAFLAMFVGFIYAMMQNQGNVSRKERISAFLFLLCLMQSRYVNIGLWLLFLVAAERLYDVESPIDMALRSLILQEISFFALGNSNSLSSIDLSNAYNGIGDYNLFAVGFLTFFSNWAGPIWWAVAANKRGKGYEVTRNFMALFFSIALTSLMLACTVLRSHLFIWTVFSPKLLFQIAWCVQYWVVNVLLGAIL
jgi:ethanolaminephosphotransferase